VRRAAAAIACLLALATAPALVAQAQDPGDLRERERRAADRERALQGDVGRLDALVARVARQVAVLERRRAEVQADLDRDRARLAAVRASLRAERARLARLRGRLDEARRVLAERLVAGYQAPRLDVVTVVLRANGFADLLERAEFLRRVEENDEQIIAAVRRARDDARTETQRLARREREQAALVAALRTRRDALAGMTAAAARRRAALDRLRAARTAALAAARATRRRLAARRRAAERAAERARAALAAAEAQTAAPGAGASGPSGGWAIPWPIVQCESGGQNLPPNSAGASGYYQIIPETWRGAGGRGPAAWRAPRAEQDRVARILWDGGRGASNWVCADLVG